MQRREEKEDSAINSFVLSPLCGAISEALRPFERYSNLSQGCIFPYYIIL